MRGQPDWTYTVKLWGDRALNDKGWDTLLDALDNADLEGEIGAAVQAAVTKYLPRPPREREVPEWFECEVQELDAGAAICPDPAAHTAHTVKSSLRAAQEPT